MDVSRYVLRGQDEAKEVGRNQIMYRLIKHARNFGIFPKSNMKPLNYFQEDLHFEYCSG